jgi:hypothetical protein
VVDKLMANVANKPIQQTDRLFFDSPDKGDPTCLCSRCLQPIGEDDLALRAWPQDGSNGEFRYCEACQEEMGIHCALEEVSGGHIWDSGGVVGVQS